MEKTRPASSSSAAASILSYLPDRASFSHRPHSPGGDAIQQLQRRGFSGPMVSIVPAEARRRKQRFEAGPPSEPTSPRVTCMGEVKLRKMAARCSGKMKQKPLAEDRLRLGRSRLLIGRMFRRREGKPRAADGGGGSSQDVLGAAESRAAAPARAPLLGQMRRFASGRESLGEFDWRKAASGDSHEEEEEVLVPHSAPLMVGSGVPAAAVEPRKEVNIRKRRTLSPATPLQLIS